MQSVFTSFIFLNSSYTTQRVKCPTLAKLTILSLDVEGREVSEETSEETDVEDQFSPVPPAEQGGEQAFSFDTPVDSHPSFRPRHEPKQECEELATPVDKDEVTGSLSFSVSSQVHSEQMSHKGALIESHGVTKSKIIEETVAMKVETKECVAYDNVAFKEDDDDKPPVGISISKTSRPQYVKQETKDISPEDLTEKPAAFDFPEHYSMYMDVSKEWQEEEKGGTVEEEPSEDVGAAGGSHESRLESTTLEATLAVEETTSGVSGQTGDKVLERISESSSGDGDVEVVDENTGERAKLPWEVAHHYSRQFSEVFKEEQKSPMKHQASLDMGAFYTRDKTKDEEFLEKVFYDEPLPSTDDVQAQKRVTFAVERSEETATGKDDKDDTGSLDVLAEDTESREPYEFVKETHDSAVINIILENRQQVKEIIARKVYDPEFPATALEEDSPRIRQTRQTTRSEFDESEEDAMFTFSPRSAEGYELETRSEFTESRSFSYEGHGVVSKESRMAHQELLMQEEDIEEEEDRSLSPSRDSKSKILSTTFEETVITHKTPPAHPTHFPMAVHSVGKSLADNEIYESSETERDSTEEKLSPIEETPSLDEMEEDTLKSTTPTVEKRVTFQTDRLAATRFSEQSVDDFKASSSSSELSVEPTLLAASYDLDSGSVCHVVAAYDISPDTVEKQGPAEVSGKAILSSPEDDVFEMDAQAAMAAAAANQKEEFGYLQGEPNLASSLLRGHLLARVDVCSSPTIPDAPVSTPREGASGQDLSQSLWTASTKLERFQDVDRTDSKDGEDSTLHEGESSPTEDRSLAETKSDAGSPIGDDFVPRSPIESQDSLPACEISRREEQVEEMRGVIVINGPTEVDYIPEYDDDNRTAPVVPRRAEQVALELDIEKSDSFTYEQDPAAVQDSYITDSDAEQAIQSSDGLAAETYDVQQVSTEIKEEGILPDKEQMICPIVISTVEAKPEVQQASTEAVEEESPEVAVEQSIQPSLISTVEAKPEVQQASTEAVEEESPEMAVEQSIQPSLISTVEAKPEVQQASAEAVEEESPEMVVEQSIQPSLVSTVEAKPEVQQASTEAVEEESPETVVEQSIQPSLISTVEAKPEVQQASTEAVEEESPEMAVEQSIQPSLISTVEAKPEVQQVSTEAVEEESPEMTVEQRIQPSLITTVEAKPEVQQASTEAVEEESPKMAVEQSIQPSLISTVEAKPEVQQASTEAVEEESPEMAVEQSIQPSLISTVEAKPEVQQVSTEAVEEESPEMTVEQRIQPSLITTVEAKPEVQQASTEAVEEESPKMAVEQSIQPSLISTVEAKPEVQQASTEAVEEESPEMAVEQSIQPSLISTVEAKPEVQQASTEVVEEESPEMAVEQSIQPSLISTVEAKPEVQQASTEAVEEESPEMAVEQSIQPSLISTVEAKPEVQQASSELEEESEVPGIEQMIHPSVLTTVAAKPEVQQVTTEIEEGKDLPETTVEHVIRPSLITSVEAKPDVQQATQESEISAGEAMQAVSIETYRTKFEANKEEVDEMDGKNVQASMSFSLQAKPDIQQPEKDEDETDYGIEKMIVPSTVDYTKAKPDIQQPEDDNGKSFPVEEEPIQSATRVSFSEARPEVCQPEGEETRPSSQVISEGIAPRLLIMRQDERGSDDDEEEEEDEKDHKTPGVDTEETQLKVQEEDDDDDDNIESDYDEKSEQSDESDQRETEDLKKGEDILDDEEKEDEETHPKEENRPAATVSVTQFEPGKYSIETDLRDRQDIGVSHNEDDDGIASSTYAKEADGSAVYDFGTEEIYHGKKALEPSPAGSLFSETYEEQEEAMEEVSASGGSEPCVESVRDEEQDDIEMGEEEEEEEFEERPEEELIRLEDAVVESEEEQGEEIGEDEEESRYMQYGRERSGSHTADPSESLHLLCTSSGSQSDLDRPLSPTPDALRQGFFSGTYTPPQSGAFTPPVTGTFTPPISGSYTPPQPPHSQGSTEESSAIEQTAVTFVDSILEDVKVKVSSETVSTGENEQGLAEGARVMERAAEPVEHTQVAVGEAKEDIEPLSRDFSELGNEKKGVTLVKQISEDIPGIILTQHLHKELDEDEYYGYSPQPSSISEEDEDRYNVEMEEAGYEKPMVYDDAEQVQKDTESKESIEGEADVEMDLEKELDQDEGLIGEIRGQDDDEEEEEDQEDEADEELQCIDDGEDEEEEYESEEASPELPGYRRDAKPDSPGTSSAAIVVQTQKTAITHDFPEDTPSDEEKGFGDNFESSSPSKARDDKSQKPLHFLDETSISSGSPRGMVGEHMMASHLDMESGSRQAHEDLDTSLSQSDYGDTSSVDSFATVVVADSEEHQTEFDENRLAEIASMTSSFTSDMQMSFHDEEGDAKHRDTEDTEEDLEEEDEDEEEEVEVEDMERSQEWVSSTPEDNRESSSSLDSDRYEFVDRAALSIITEMSDEDKLEMVEREDLESEAGLSDHFGSSPDFNLQSSPGMFGAKGFFKRNGNGENVSSLSSSLAEFERLEQAIPLSSSLSSIDKDTHRDTFGGSYDERKLIGFPKLSEAQESESIASSLAEFEHLEKALVISSSGSSVEKQTTSDSKSSGGSRGSNENNSTSVASSLNEFERLEREIQAADSDGRKSSVESSARPSEASSLNSLNEFERLEHEMVVASELEAEAQKIVSILESGVLVTSATQFGSSDLSEGSGWDGEERGASKGAALETDSLDGERDGDDDDVEHDSLSEGHKAGRDVDADSLDGESSEMTEMTSSVVYAGPDNETVAIHPEAGVLGSEFDTDSLQGEAIMQLSSDSLALEQMLKTSDSTKFDTDSLFEIDDRMMRSGDSLGGHSSSGGQPSDKNVMHASVDSLEMDLNKEDSKERQRRDTNKEEEEADRAESPREDVEAEASSDVVGAAQEEENLVIEGGPEDDNLLECGAPQDEGNLMMASLESAAWSMGSSGCTTSHSMSVSHSESSHSHDLMQVSTESDILKGSIVTGPDKKWAAWDLPISEEKHQFHKEESSYHSASVYHVSATSTLKSGGGTIGSGSGSCSASSSRSSSQRSSPRRSKLRRDSLEEERHHPFNPFADWGPYQETKKVYTMAEWEEMKRLKRERQEAEERQRAEEMAAASRSSPDLSTRPEVLARVSYIADTEKHEREVFAASALSFSSPELVSREESRERTISSSSTSSTHSQIRVECSRERTISSSSTSSTQSVIRVHPHSPPASSPAQCTVSSTSSTHSSFTTSTTSTSHKRGTDTVYVFQIIPTLFQPRTQLSIPFCFLCSFCDLRCSF